MCGIVGYIGTHEAEPDPVEGLRRLEYRGYDSAGAGDPRRRPPARPQAGRAGPGLEEALDREPAPGSCGISHTRWATHGPATDRNAHPHLGGDGRRRRRPQRRHRELRRPQAASCEAEGVVFRSETDTEVIAHLIARELGDGTTWSTPSSGPCPGSRGPTAWPSSARRCPGLIVGARLGSPLVLGLGDGEHFLASDPSALVGHTRRRSSTSRTARSCVLTADDCADPPPRARADHRRAIDRIDWEPDDAELGGFEHYMLKEIYEQPETLENAMRGRLDRRRGDRPLRRPEPRRRSSCAGSSRVILTACGTSCHAALVGEYLFEELARMPVEVEYASEFRYRNPPIDRNTHRLRASRQSGETADTLAALREAKRKGHPTLAHLQRRRQHDRPRGRRRRLPARRPGDRRRQHQGVHRAGRRADDAGPVPRAGCGTCQLRRGPADDRGAARPCPTSMRPDAGLPRPASSGIAEKYCHARNFLYLGRQYHFPVALEGALKLKEISYIHAEGYPAAEMKHGPIALVDERRPACSSSRAGRLYDKVMSNLEEIKARGGPVIAIATEGDDERGRAGRRRHLRARTCPSTCSRSSPSIPLQLLAYHIALLARLRRRQAAQPGEERDGGVRPRYPSGAGRQPEDL